MDQFLSRIASAALGGLLGLPLGLVTVTVAAVAGLNVDPETLFCATVATTAGWFAIIRAI